MSLYQTPEDNSQGLSQLDLVICAPLADRLPACSLVWWLARAIDRKGSGKAEFSLAEAAEALGKSEKTIRRYLKEALSCGLFRFVNVKQNRVTVYMTSLIKLAHIKGMEQLGTFARIKVSELQTLKFLVTEIEADALQRQSKYRKGVELDVKRTHAHIDLIERIFKNSSEVCSGENTNKPIKKRRKPEAITDSRIIHVGNRAAFVTQEFTVYGGSQAAIAARLGRSDRTIRKRLSNPHREARGVSPIMKKQICQQVNNFESDWKELTRALYDEGDYETAKETARFFNSRGRSFQSRNNVYFLDYELVSKKSRKKHYSTYLATLSTPNSPEGEQGSKP